MMFLRYALPINADGDAMSQPKAFVVLKDGQQVGSREIIDHVRDRLAHFKAPDAVDMVDALPKTSTGKIQKYVLRDKEWAGHDRRAN